MKTISKILILTFLIFQPVFSQNLETKIDSLIPARFKSENPGAVFLAVKKGKIIYRKAFGMADLEMNVKMKPEFVFEIGSMTKQFTAFSILILAEQGKLKLEDEITKFIPDYPTNGNRITIHHLLTHTSGIKDFTSMKSIKNIAREDLSPKELVDFFKNEPVDFKPGEEYKYCNSGYVLLGFIIEIVSGKTYEDFLSENIFKKAGMQNTYYASHDKIIKNRVSGYRGKEVYSNANYISFSIPYASGAIMSNVDDLLKWQNAIDNNTVLGSVFTQKAFTNYQLNNGTYIDYGYGWHLEKVKNKTVREHGGSIFGFKSMGVYVPEEQLYVVGLSNCDCNSPTEITKNIALLLMD
ncbi:serine hydrolase domain-containing protein [Flavobacterium hungaricum]|uniref:Class A beta-lactamase-related serine hydrolase n=1 Tax=Flavobacterium hungaricum TaxID=2082725 RepID=A0ABR9TJT1_9FLAO|nr:serine hydrolase domain-containing protein [Flavobacterium hungaricum]MBE8725626.1 class A beta-lactamase-related serine hydrolase [Flavobacterium hungaricum]